MARIDGVRLPENKCLDYALTYLFGIGIKTSRDILKSLKFDCSKRVKTLTDEEVASIQKAISHNYRIEGDLHKEISMNIRRLQEIGAYRGLRHKRGLPARGQRTKTNARTRKGPRKAGGAVALKRKVTKK